MPSSYILVSLDGSARAEAILPYALAMARETACCLLLLNVITPPQEQSRSPLLLSDGWYDDEYSWSQHYLASTARRLQGQGVQVYTETLKSESAGASIISYTRRHTHVTMVALATRGQGNVGPWILGSVAEQVMHAASVPLLLLHPHEHVDPEHQPIFAKVYRNIIVPLDGTPLDERALDYTRMLVKPNQTSVTLVAISPLPDEDDLDDDQQTPHVEDAGRQAQRAAYLARQAEKLRSITGLTVKTELATGNSEAWIEHLTQKLSDVLVITSYHHYADRLALRFLQTINVPLLLVLY